MKPRKRYKTIVLLAVAGLTALSGCPQTPGLTLATDGKTTYQIVVSAKADVSTKAVAADMAAILKEITGDWPATDIGAPDLISRWSPIQRRRH